MNINVNFERFTVKVFKSTCVLVIVHAKVGGELVRSFLG